MALISVLVVAVVVSGGTFAFSIGILLQCLSIIIFFYPFPHAGHFFHHHDGRLLVGPHHNDHGKSEMSGPSKSLCLDFLYNKCPKIFFPGKRKTLSEFGGLGRTTTLAKITKREGRRNGKAAAAAASPHNLFSAPGKKRRRKRKRDPPLFLALFSCL